MSAIPPGAGSALVAAALFGASVPLSRMLVGDVHPLLLAGLLYVGSGCGLALMQVVRSAGAMPGAATAWPVAREWGWLAGAVLSGGIVGPVLLMYGLTTSDAASASLLLNLESVLTALFAWFLFGENFDRRIAFGMALVVAGGVVLAWSPGAGGVSAGSLFVAAACLCWAVDNNLTRKVSASDAVVIAGIKGLVAGVAMVGGALVLQVPLPATATIAAAAVVGFLGYGISLVLFVLALRNLGTARTGAYFALAPFFGALIAILTGQGSITAQLVVAGALMGVGVWLHLTERHEHEHVHEPATHDHPHVHDEHHRHEHAFAWDGAEPHAHSHAHERLVHRHRHFPDIHHRHPH